ncbi:response regulator transcription factor [Bariatricus sp. SGI.161]|uniref:response regulator transcription factor n=1 Tax=Bariatricus sp. SGI.161 TaxID=3420550 RepID=UPI003CFC7BF9
MRALRRKHPEVEIQALDLRDEANAMERFDRIREEWDSFAGTKWMMFDGMDASVSKACVARIADYIRTMPSECKVIIAGRDWPEEAFLDLVWKRQMQIIPQKTLQFTEKEISNLVKYYNSNLSPEDIYKRTGGWAGCADMLIRLSSGEGAEQSGSVEAWMESYEIRTYVRRKMLDPLPNEEREMIQRAILCPWITEDLCSEVWQDRNTSDLLERLGRKGLLVHDKQKNRWKAAPILQKNDRMAAPILQANHVRNVDNDFWKRLGSWYEKHRNIKEALQCLKESEEKAAYRSCMLRHYSEVPLLGIPYAEVMNWKGNEPELCYLRGICSYARQQVNGLKAEIQNLNAAPEDDSRKREIYLNLTYRQPDLDLDSWLVLLKTYTKDKEHIQLYDIQGYSYSCLCGLRDLSGLFACAKKEENRKARLWKERLGKEAWICYRLARIEYYLETERRDAISVDDWKLLLKDTENDQEDRQEKKQGKEAQQEQRQTIWQKRLARVYLLCRLQQVMPEEEHSGSIRKLALSLQQEEHLVCKRLTDAVLCLYAPAENRREHLAKWLVSAEQSAETLADEACYAVLCCRAKGCLQLNQYKRAEKILHYLVPYLQLYRRYKHLAEALFQQAVIHWVGKRKGQALKDTIESFVVNGTSRYVGFYTEYDRIGKALLEDYVDWLSKNSPGGWNRKKKYNYGNVLRMPEADYMGVVLRCAKRRMRSGSSGAEDTPEEQLTMMETIILQDINRGLTNTQICEELNLKLPTVKTHIYNLYKKLGVNNRVQAIRKGKEEGILDER